MKKHVLPAVIALALSASPVFAEQAAVPAAAAPAATMPAPGMPFPPPAAMPTPPGMPAPPAMPEAADYEKLMAERAQHMQSMQEYHQKMAQTADPAERQKLMDEYNQKMQEHMEKMRAMGMPARGGPGMGRGPMGMQPPMPGQAGPWRMQVEERLGKIEKALEEIQSHIQAEGK